MSFAAIEDGIRLEEGSHPIDVSHPLPGNQQALQILGITRRLAVWPIAHGDISSNGFRSSNRIARAEARGDARPLNAGNGACP
jgi:hypothetical protein